jgi:hypothetical protein
MIALTAVIVIISHIDAFAVAHRPCACRNAAAVIAIFTLITLNITIAAMIGITQQIDAGLAAERSRTTVFSIRIGAVLLRIGTVLLRTRFLLNFFRRNDTICTSGKTKCRHDNEHHQSFHIFSRILYILFKRRE